MCGECQGTDLSHIVTVMVTELLSIIGILAAYTFITMTTNDYLLGESTINCNVLEIILQCSHEVVFLFFLYYPSMNIFSSLE